MSIEWHVHTDKQELRLSHSDLLQQIHSGNLSIRDWVKHPEQSSWSRIHATESIVDDLLVEYIKNDYCYGPVTGRQLSEYYNATKIKKNTPVKVIGQELWHHYSLICHAKKPQKQAPAPIPLPIIPDAHPIALRKMWTVSDVMILALSAASLAACFACYYLHHP